MRFSQGIKGNPDLPTPPETCRLLTLSLTVSPTENGVKKALNSCDAPTGKSGWVEADTPHGGWMPETPRAALNPTAIQAVGDTLKRIDP